MYSIRSTKTASLKTAVQVIQYQRRKTIVVKHIGSGSNSKEILQLRRLAEKWIETTTKQERLFKDEENQDNNLTPLNKYQYLGIRYSFAYEVINKIFYLLGFHRIRSRLLLDLILIRLMEPASKLRSLTLLQEYFGLTYRRSSVYRFLPLFVSFKEEVERKVMLYAQKHLYFDFKVVFYDVTTLYFETDKSDELRQCGFSKDHKFNQPQILLGLVVNRDGFPLCYEIFEGKKFEGHTLLPLISQFKDKYHIPSLTVVADAAMLSLDNINELLKYQLSYIVGARAANLPLSLIKTISTKLDQKPNSSLRLPTDYGFLVCDFSSERYRKDKHEMNKQIKKALSIVRNPTKDKKIPKAKFIKTVGKSKYVLNQKLIDKTKLILGIKSYYTNLETINNQEIINQYHNLWKVEKAFRITKSDLKSRPIFHFKKQTIQGHVLICFMALCVAKYLELSTGRSFQSILRLLKSVTDARMFNTITNRETAVRSSIPKELKQILKTLGLSY